MASDTAGFSTPELREEAGVGETGAGAASATGFGVPMTVGLDSISAGGDDGNRGDAGGEGQFNEEG